MTRMNVVSWGLFAAWVVNDVEELLTMSADSRLTLQAAPARWPIPDELRTQGLSQAHVTTSICLMGGLMAAASADGARTGGHSWLFRSTLLAFGLHGFTHLASAARAGRWTTGSRTSPIAVIPYWLWASRELRRAGIPPLKGVSWPFVASAPLILAATHAAAWAVRRLAGGRHPLTR